VQLRHGDSSRPHSLSSTLAAPDAQAFDLPNSPELESPAWPPDRGPTSRARTGIKPASARFLSRRAIHDCRATFVELKDRVAARDWCHAQTVRLCEALRNPRCAFSCAFSKRAYKQAGCRPLC
jgi:hypothetical protein